MNQTMKLRARIAELEIAIASAEWWIAQHEDKKAWLTLRKANVNPLLSYPPEEP